MRPAATQETIESAVLRLVAEDEKRAQAAAPISERAALARTTSDVPTVRPSQVECVAHLWEGDSCPFCFLLASKQRA